MNDDGATYSVRVVNELGDDTSSTATLTVNAFSGPYIAGASVAPVIDGNIEEIWSSLESNSVQNVTVGAVDSDTDLSSTFRTLWDEDNLYLLVEITDNTIVI